MDASRSEPPAVTNLPTLVPLLHTARLTLEPLDLRHAPGIQKHIVDWEIVRHLTAAPWPYPPDGAEQYINATLPKMRKGESYAWAVTLRGGSGEAIGCISFERGESTWSRGFWLAREHHGKGYMSEAVLAATDFAFGEGGIDRLVIATFEGNDASNRIKQKMPGRCIAREEAKDARPGAGYTHRWIWEITKEEWLASRPRG